MSAYGRVARRQVQFVRYAALFGSAVSLVYCGEVSGIGQTSPVPVVQILLVAGQPSQTASVQYSAPAEPIVPLIQVPVDADSVVLELVGSDGSHTPFEAIAGSPTTFQASRLVAPGETYTLSGTVAGVHLTATATVPETLQVRAPAQDTLFFSLSSGLTSVPFSWFAAGANSYVVRQSDRNGNTGLVFATTDTVGTLPVTPFFSFRPDTTELAILAYDPSAASFFLARGSLPRSSGTAAVVGFGAAVRLPTNKIVVWQP
jgi:hypothetical protein